MTQRVEQPVETYGYDHDHDHGPILDVSAGRRRSNRCAWFELSAGDWGISIGLSEGEVRRLRNQLSGLLGESND